MIASAAWARSAMSNWLGLRMISRQARVNADRRLRAYSALGRLSGMGLGHGRFGARPCFAQTVRLGPRAPRPYPSIYAESGRQCHLSYRHVDRFPAARAWNRRFPRTDAGASRKAAHFAWNNERRGPARKTTSRDHRYTACRKLQPLK